VTPEEAAGFYEDDEDPAAVFARFDAGHDFAGEVDPRFRAQLAAFMDQNDELLRRLAKSERDERTGGR
jgi:hypothetical protein